MTTPPPTFDEQLCALIREHLTAAKDQRTALHEIVMSLVFQACQGSDKMLGIRSLSRRQIKQIIDLSYRQLDENKTAQN